MELMTLGLAVGSAILLGVTILGDCGWALRRNGGGRLPQSADAEGSCEPSVKQFAAALPRVAEVGAEAFFVTLCQRLSGRFDHGEARFNIWSNWLFWAASRWVGRLKMIENTEHLFRYSRRALCHQMAQALVDVAGRTGQKARLVGLDGHVVAEGYYHGRWHGFDPDYGVVYRHAGQVLPVEEVVASPQIAAELYRQHRLPNDSREVLAILARGHVTRIVPGAHLSPRTVHIQRLFHGLKWVIPTLGLLAAVLLWLVAINLQLGPC